VPSWRGDPHRWIAPRPVHTTYCIHLLAAASRLPSKSAVRRLAAVTMAGLHRIRDQSLSVRDPVAVAEARGAECTSAEAELGRALLAWRG
jgi:hypothetical protein